MTRITFSQLIAGALVSLCLATVPARALNDHTYVSGKGTDTGGCTHPAIACRTFAFAIAQTLAGGTIIAIDPANYGAVTITKSISIVADGGGPAGIFVTGGNAITINVGANEIINLRGLTLDGAGTADNGITYSTGTTVGESTVTITDCFIRHFKTAGISLGGTNSTFYISNTVSADNTGGTGLLIGTILASFSVVDHFTTSGNKLGINLVGNHTSGGDLKIVDSVILDGLLVGIQGFSTPTATLAGSVVGSVNISPGSTGFSYGDNEIGFVSGILTPVAKR